MKLYSSATNSRGKESGTGGGAKSQTVHTRTWDCGVRVESEVQDDKTVIFKVYRTGGSNNERNIELIATIKESDYAT